MDVAQRHGLLVIEDAAQGILSGYKGRALGSIGHMGCLSFHETKNIIAGEGGAFLANDARFLPRAEIIRDKGTNRGQFFRGEVDRYTWCDMGSSHLPGEVPAAFLWAQMQEAEDITRRRLALWDHYHQAFAAHEQAGRVRRPIVPAHCRHNAHMYYLLLPDADLRTRFIQALGARGVGAVFHYVPLHSSPAGSRYGRVHGAMTNTEVLADRLVRLPLWVGLEPQVDEVISAVGDVLGGRGDG